MPRKLTKNAATVAERGTDTHLRNTFKSALRHMSLFDKTLLADILNFYVGGSLEVPGELKLASVFESSLHSIPLMVLYENEYFALTKRLAEAEAFRNKVTMMPSRGIGITCEKTRTASEVPPPNDDRIPWEA